MGWDRPPVAFVLLIPYTGQTTAQGCVGEKHKVFRSLEQPPNSAQEIREGFPEEVTLDLALKDGWELAGGRRAFQDVGSAEPGEGPGGKGPPGEQSPGGCRC